jgi:hypothetical protein
MACDPESETTLAQVAAVFRNKLITHLVESDFDIARFMKSEPRYQAAKAGEAEAGGSPAGTEPPPAVSGPRPGSMLDTTRRLSNRYTVSLDGLVTNANGTVSTVTVTNLSQDGARLSGLAGLFRETTGTLRLPTTALPELPFVVIGTLAQQARVWFTLTPRMRSLIANEFRYPAFKVTVLGLSERDPASARHGDRAGGPDGTDPARDEGGDGGGGGSEMTLIELAGGSGLG